MLSSDQHNKLDIFNWTLILRPPNENPKLPSFSTFIRYFSFALPYDKERLYYVFLKLSYLLEEYKSIQKFHHNRVHIWLKPQWMFVVGHGYTI